MDTREKTKQVRVGKLSLGGGAPIWIQSMTNTKTRDAEATIRQIHALEEAGCEIVRATVPDRESAEAFWKIKENISIRGGYSFRLSSGDRCRRTRRG